MDLLAHRRSRCHPLREPPRGGAGGPRRARLRALAHLHVDRFGDNVVARTTAGRGPPARRRRPPRHGSRQRQRHPRDPRRRALGLGAADMKGRAGGHARGWRRPCPSRRSTSPGSSTPARRCRRITTASVICSPSGRTWWRAMPPSWASPPVPLSKWDARAPCASVWNCSVSAPTRRPWMGRNALHRAGRVLLDDYVARQPMIDGCTYHEALQAVFVEGRGGQRRAGQGRRDAQPPLRSRPDQRRGAGAHRRRARAAPGRGRHADGDRRCPPRLPG